MSAKKKKMQFINAKEQKLETVTYSDYKDLQVMVEGYIENALEVDGHVLYVNEEGLINGLDYGFAVANLEGLELRIIGNGCLCKESRRGNSLDSTLGFNSNNLRWLEKYEIEEMKRNRPKPKMIFGEDLEEYFNKKR